MLGLIWRESALDDLEAIVDYISERNFAGAESLQLLFEECAERLPTHPFAHRIGSIIGTREAVVHPITFWSTASAQARSKWSTCFTPAANIRLAEWQPPYAIGATQLEWEQEI